MKRETHMQKISKRRLKKRAKKKEVNFDEAIAYIATLPRRKPVVVRIVGDEVLIVQAGTSR